jgi:hypothetical protein
MGLAPLLSKSEFAEVTITTGPSTLSIPDDADIILLTGTGTLGEGADPVTGMPVLRINPDHWGRRIITLIQYGTGTTTLDHNADAVLPGFADFASADLALGKGDSVSLYVRPDGALMQLSKADL